MRTGEEDLRSFPGHIRCFFVFYLFGCTRSQLWHAATLAESLEVLVAACGTQFPDQGLNLGPLQWEFRVSATGLPGKFPHQVFLKDPKFTEIVILLLYHYEIHFILTSKSFCLHITPIWMLKLLIQTINIPNPINACVFSTLLIATRLTHM